MALGTYSSQISGGSTTWLSQSKIGKFLVTMGGLLPALLLVGSGAIARYGRTVGPGQGLVKAGRREDSYRSARCWRSASVRGKNRLVSDRKRLGRHVAGRPHISVAGSLLWRSPSTWPSSWAMRLRATFGSDSGGPSALRMIATPCRATLPGGNPTEMKWVPA